MQDISFIRIYVNRFQLLSFFIFIEGESAYSIAMARIEAVSQWLECVTTATVQEEVEISLASEDENDYLNAIFSHLTSRQISQACVLAQQKGNYS